MARNSALVAIFATGALLSGKVILARNSAGALGVSIGHDDVSTGCADILRQGRSGAFRLLAGDAMLMFDLRAISEK